MSNPARELVKPVESLTRYQMDVLRSAKDNHIWLNAFACVRPTDDFLISIGRQIVQMLEDRESLIIGDTDGTCLEKLKQREIVLRINKS